MKKNQADILKLKYRITEIKRKLNGLAQWQIGGAREK